MREGYKQEGDARWASPSALYYKLYLTKTKTIFAYSREPLNIFIVEGILAGYRSFVFL